MSTTQYIRVDGTEEGINFDGRFKVKGSEGIAYFLLGWAADYVPSIGITLDEEGEEVEFEDWEESELARSGDSIVAVMVGDDHKWIVDKSDLTEIDEEDYCSCCGQIGCGWN